MKSKVMFISIVFIILSFSFVSAEVPKMINYQGKVTTPQGALIDTIVSIQFSIYPDNITQTPLWRETQETVQVEKGIFNVLLGSVIQIPDSVFDGNVKYLGVKVGEDLEMVPRKAIVSVGYAYYADMVDGMNGSAFVQKPSDEAQGDILYYDGSVWTRLPAGTSGHYLKTQGGGANPVWSEVIAVPADNSISQAKLKTATGEVSGSGHHNNLILPGGEYGFYPQIKGSDISGPDEVDIAIANEAGNVTSYRTNICINQGSDIYIKQRYVTSSGKDHWMFFLIDKETKQAEAGYQAPDHPCYGSGGDENDIPHPFGSYDPEKHEVILIDNEILPELKSKVTSKRSLLTIINEEYEIDFDSEPVYQPREIIEIDGYGDKGGEILQKIKTPGWAKILIGKDEIYLKRRLVETLPSYISYKKLKPKFDVIAESKILSQSSDVALGTQPHTK